MAARHLCNPGNNGLTPEQRLGKLPWRHDPIPGADAVPGGSPEVYGGLDAQLLSRNRYLEAEVLRLKRARSELALQSAQGSGAPGVGVAGGEVSSSGEEVAEAGAGVGALPAAAPGPLSGSSAGVLALELQRLREESDGMLARMTEMQAEHDRAVHTLKHRVEELVYEGACKDSSVEVLRQQWTALSTEFESLKQQSEIDRQLGAQRQRQLQQQLQLDSGERVSRVVLAHGRCVYHGGCGV